MRLLAHGTCVRSPEAGTDLPVDGALAQEQGWACVGAGGSGGGIAGATTIEDNVILWGQVGVSKTLTIGKDAIIYAQSGVKDSIAGGKVYFGSPVEDAREKMKEFVWIKRIPQLWEKVMGK